MLKNKSFLIICLAFMMLLVPMASFAAPQEETFVDEAQIKSDAAENYDAAKQQMEDIYYDAVERMVDNGGLTEGKPIDEWAYEKFYRFYMVCRNNWGFVVGFCEVLGIVILVLARKNRKFQKFALWGLMIAIPGVYSLFVLLAGTSPMFARL